MTSPPHGSWRLCTPGDRAGAVAVFLIRGHLERLWRPLGIAPVPVGEARLRALASVDHGLVSVLSSQSALVMPHGGPEVVRQLCAAWSRSGVHRDERGGPQARYPEARSDFEAALLDTLSRAASPAAIDLLLVQPARWAAAGIPDPPPEQPDPDPEHSAALDRLVTPPLILALGPSNVGKSTLLNRLAGRAVAITADEPGTTRDHVGALIDLDGLVARYIDTPGLRPDAPEVEREAGSAALALASRADLLLLLGDAAHPPPSSPDPARAALTIALRADLGLPPWPHAVALSARTGAGVAAFVRLLRETLLPPQALEAPAPWRFW